MDITLEVTVDALLEAYPQAAGFLAGRRVVCIMCGEPYWGTLGELMASKGITDPQALLQELRDYLRAS